MDALPIQAEITRKRAVTASILNVKGPCVADMWTKGQSGTVIDLQEVGTLILNTTCTVEHRCIINKIHGIMVNCGEGVIACVLLLPGEGYLTGFFVTVRKEQQTHDQHE